MSRSKSWCFTVNNYTEDELNELRGLESGSGCTYLVCGIERGDSGTPHIQGYIEFGSRLRLATVKRIRGFGRAHLEVRRGTASQASTYCKKEEDFFEYGTISLDNGSNQGKRTDLDRCVELIRDGGSLHDLWTDFPTTMVKYHRGLTEALHRLRPAHPMETFDIGTFDSRRTPDLSASGVSHVIIGAPGSGKTCYAKAMYPRALFVSHMDDLGEFNAEVHEAIIFDDMSFRHMPRNAQIHLVDQDNDRSIHIRYKVAKIPAHTKKIFTGNEQIFEDDGAINRRIKVHQVDKLFVEEGN